MYPIVDGPWGGGNQFLKALRVYLRDRGVYSESPGYSDVLLFNADKRSVVQETTRLIGWRVRRAPVVVNRIDGPVFYKNPRFIISDRLINMVDRYLCDGAVLQSNWCLEEMRRIGYERTENISILYNAPDPRLFFSEEAPPAHERTVVIAASWSPNPEKGFDIYEYLDRHLDFTRYRMFFVGNSPIQFENVEHVEPLDSEALGELFRQCDIFITASRDDPCSNALIEALSCGLPAAVINSGGHPELLGEGGVVFNDRTDVLSALSEIRDNLPCYRDKLPLFRIERVGAQYYEFMKTLWEARRTSGWRYGLAGRLVNVARAVIVWMNVRRTGRRTGY